MRKIVPLLVVVLLTFGTVGSLGAATPKPRTISRTYPYTAGQGVADIPNEIIEGGVTYRIKTPIGKPYTAATYTSTKNYTATQSAAGIPAREVESGAFANYFATVIPINDAGYTGAMTRQSFEKTPYYISRTRVVEYDVEYPGLSHNDISTIPETREFTVTTDEGDNTTTKKALRVAAIEWEITDENDDGIPIQWTALVTYRGEESYRTLESYNVVAYFRGVATRPEQDLEIEAVFEEVIEEEEVVEEVAVTYTPPVIETTKPVETAPVEEVRRNWVPYVAAAAAASTAAIAIPVIFFRLFNGTIVDHEDKRVSRVRIKREEGWLKMVIGDTLADRLTRGGPYFLIPAARLLNGDEPLSVSTESGAKIYSGSVEDKIHLDMKCVARVEAYDE